MNPDIIMQPHARVSFFITGDILRCWKKPVDDIPLISDRASFR
jgi:hypothetical protein